MSPGPVPDPELQQAVGAAARAGREGEAWTGQAEVEIVACLDPSARDDGVAGIVGGARAAGGWSAAGVVTGSGDDVLAVVDGRVVDASAREIRPVTMPDGRPGRWMQTSGSVPELDRATPGPDDLSFLVTSLGTLTGAARAVLDATVERARTREQFGRPVGTFQATAHRLVDALVDVDAMELALDELVAEGGGRVRTVAPTWTWAADAAARVVASAHQVWGGEGYLARAPVHRWAALVTTEITRLRPVVAALG